MVRLATANNRGVCHYCAYGLNAQSCQAASGKGGTGAAWHLGTQRAPTSHSQQLRFASVDAVARHNNRSLNETTETTDAEGGAVIVGPSVLAIEESADLVLIIRPRMLIPQDVE
jgi:hypothetical protein